MVEPIQVAMIRGRNNSYSWLPVVQGENSTSIVQIDGQWFVADSVPGFVRFEWPARIRLGPLKKN